jgi:2-methylcitrate dehydratase PrpD
MSLTGLVADFVSQMQIDAVPARALEAARTGITDCVGVMIAGAAEEAVRIVAAMAVPSMDAAAAPQVPSGRRLASSDAALVNGVAAHALDYDDVAMAAHPSAVLVPALLAEGWSLEAAGEDMVLAYVAGYELWAALDALEPGRLHARGFHPTAVLGTLAAAGACARLRRLNAGQTRHAIGIAASLASGLVANFGTMTKPLHAGRAAQSGVLAARLAAEGFTAAPDILEHRSGFLRAHSPSRAPRLDDAALQIGADWRLEQRGIDIKRYPTCYATHRCIDAMLELASGHDLEPDDVAQIDVRTGATQLLLLRNPRPGNALEGKFSMEFAMAAALVARGVGLAQVTDEFVVSPDVRAAVAKVRCTTTDEMMAGDELFAPDDRVSVRLTSGAILTHPPVVHAKGSWHRPLTQAELADKFRDCTRAMPSDQSAALFEQLWSIRTLTSLRALRLTLPPDLTAPRSTAP